MFLSIKDLKKSFGEDEYKTEVLKGIDFEIEKGEICVLLGPSGSGKSTLLNIIGGIDQPDSGTITIQGKTISTLKEKDLTNYRRNHLGYVFQMYNLISHLNVEQNIDVGKYLSKNPLNKEELLQTLGLKEHRYKQPNQLSGGQQQRVAIARALVKEPKVLLLDEPLSNLDARLRLQTREEIKRIQRETGITTVFVTHDQEEAMSISDEIVVMKLGVEQQRGNPQYVYDQPVNQFVAKFLGTPPINIFKGKVEKGGLYIGDERIGNSELDDQEVTIGIRPEGFEVNPEANLHIVVKHVEYIGRDKSIVATNPNSEKDTFRIIIEASVDVKEGETIAVSVKPNKCFVFDKLTEKRIQ